MKKRGNKLIDKGLQLNISYSIIRISLVVISLVMALLVISAFLYTSRVTGTIEDLNKTVETEDNIVNAFIKLSYRTGDQRMLLSAKNVREDHDKSMAIISEHISILQKFNMIFLYIIAAVFLIIIIHTVMLFIYTIRVTHRISGPIYLMTRQIDDIMEGREPDFRELREKDELKEFYTRLKELYEKKIL